MKRIRANTYLLASEYAIAMLKSLRDGVTVTEFVLEPHVEDDKLPSIEFELRVTRYGNDRLPRVTTAMSKRAKK